MPRTSQLQAAFNAGIIGPRVKGRTDYSKFGNGVADMHNAFGIPAGPVTFRPGTVKRAKVYDNTVASRLIPFRYNNEQAYMIELGPGVARFLKDGSVVLSATEIINGDFGTGDLTGWTTLNSGTGSASYSSGAAALAGGASGVGAIYQKLTYTGIAEYTVTLDVIDHDVSIKLGTTAGDDDIAGPISLTTGTGKTFTFTPSQAYDECYLTISNSANNTAKVDNIEIDTPEYVIDTRYTKVDQVAITNGTFDSSLTGWTTITTSGGAATWLSGRAYLNGSASGTAAISQAISGGLVGANTYTVTLDVAVTSMTIKIGTTSGASDIDSGTVSAGVGQTFSFNPGADYGTAYITIYTNYHGAGSPYVDNIKMTTTGTYDVNNTDIDDIQYSQSGDYIYLASGGNQFNTHFLARYGDAAWKYGELSFQDGPYLDINQDDNKTLSASATTGTVTITASGHSPFVSTDIGRMIRMKVSSTWSWLTITGYTSATEVSALVHRALDSTSATSDWRLGAFSETTGYASVISMHEGRLALANTEYESNRYWLSESAGLGGDTVLYAPSASDGTVSDSHAATGTLASGSVASIRWISSGNDMAIGTIDGEWVAQGSDTTKALSPSNLRNVQMTGRGVEKNVRPVRIDGIVLFAKRVASSICRFAFEFTKNQYASLEVSTLADNVFRNKKVLAMSYAQSPFALIWCLLDDGTLASLTFVDSEEVGGWSRHTIAGSYGGGNAVVERIACLPTDTYDQLYMVVKREINGETVRFIETLSEPFYLDDPQDAIYVDCSMTYDGTATDTITGLDYLEGEEVCILADGSVHPNRTVSGGEITLDAEYSKVTVGYYYQAEVQGLVFDWKNAFGGSSLGQFRNITDVELEVLEAGLVYAGRASQNYDDLTLLEPRRLNDIMDSAPALKTGIYQIDTLGEWDLESSWRIKFESPLPATVLAVMYSGQSNER